ncbi:solute carrier family 13 member 2-like [Pollicipes pollicipes]|uniref:solute carrier family 13 member 2-like n=1 Tax=Pollicipes pollicipes TaxID=41117 RepID=UPI0018858FF8|nr:solute carrier family 13 member 2-like [Pollicipes pollicipes]
MALWPLCLRHDVLLFWRAWVLVLVPLVLSPLPLVSGTKAAWCGYGILIIAFYWMTEAMPMAATALLPTVLFPFFGVLDTGAVSMQYMSSTNLLFLSGLMVAVAVEKSNFHTRAALRVVLFMGTSVKWLMLGFMFITMFLSMWISNTAATAMVAPMIEAVVTNLSQDLDDSPQPERKDSERSTKEDQEAAASTEIVTSTSELHVQSKPVDLRPEQLRAPLFLCVAYAANCGGTGTLTGTAPNLVLRGIVEQSYGSDTGLSFATFMLFGVPAMLLCTILGWMLLVVLFLGPKYLVGEPTDPGRISAVRRSLERRYRALGPMQFHESAVLALLVLLVLLWFFRDPQFMPGWNGLFKTDIDDGTAGMLIVALMFMIPAKPRFWCMKEEGGRSELSDGLLAWADVHKGLPWGIVLLLGGGLAIAEAANLSGLSAWLADQLVVLNTLPHGLIVFLVCAFTTLVTEISSNTAIASILLPVMAQLSNSLKINPLYLMLPTTLCCSFAFMLPVATPPNAIVYGVGNLRSQDMLKAGAFMNCICIGVVMLLIHTLGVAVFDVHTYPAWANTTIIAD